MGNGDTEIGFAQTSSFGLSEGLAPGRRRGVPESSDWFLINAEIATLLVRPVYLLTIYRSLNASWRFGVPASARCGGVPWLRDFADLTDSANGTVLNSHTGDDFSTCWRGSVFQRRLDHEARGTIPVFTMNQNRKCSPEIQKVFSATLMSVSCWMSLQSTEV